MNITQPVVNVSTNLVSLKDFFHIFIFFVRGKKKNPIKPSNTCKTQNSSPHSPQELNKTPKWGENLQSGKPAKS